MTGQIIKNISNDYTVKANSKLYICKPRGKLRINKESPLVGDYVDFDENNKIITTIHKRKNELTRPAIANVDHVIVVTSVKRPNFDSTLLDKQLTIISYNNIEPIIYFSKLDLLSPIELEQMKTIINYYKKIGYLTVTNKNELLNIIKDKIVVLSGQSGAGKTTLINMLDSNLKLQTNDISDALGRGIHTTRHTELYNILGTYIADTPGFSKIDFQNMNNIDIRDNMKEMFDNLDKCKYADCMHQKEDHCYIQELVKNKEILQSRYDNYLKFIKRDL